MPIKFDENGLVIQSLAEIKEEIKSGYTYEGEDRKGYKQFYGTGSQLADNTNMGKEITIYAEREQLLQEKIEAAYDANYRASAGGVSLDRNLENIDQKRLPAAPSSVVVYAAGTPGSPVPAEALKMKADGTGEVFFNIEDFTLGSIISEPIDLLTRVGNVATAVYIGHFPEGSFVFMSGSEQAEYNGLKQIISAAPLEITFYVSGSPVTPATGTIIAKEAAAFNAESENTGAIQVLAGALTTISTAVSGVERVENAVDATLGSETETDPELRIRASESLSGLGGATAKVIKAGLTRLSGVTFAAVFQNTTDFTDSNGLPPHSIRVIVDGGDDSDIWNYLYEKGVAAGIKMDGTEQTAIIDDNGEPQPVAFSRPTGVRIYADAGNGLVTNSDIMQGAVFPADGQDQIRANLAAIVFGLGADVWPAKIKEAIDKVAGVISSDPEFDIVNPPVNKASISIPTGERADIDSGDVTF